ncbi:MAG: 2-amino-4-hydroxy-6-hydroxymethyldihydropteridine diphosphokinase [Gammaproteobacteria bacterium]|nr:2-amino-4-hydroxy-6-hydroxymethyldihydropteridine diphosphokinase [Gammaproteobacteria bacterium]
MPDVYVGCGSNVEPESNLRWALATLEQRLGPVDRSAVYRSPAFGFDGPDFLNLVVRFPSDAGPDAVEAVLSSLENERGRNVGDRTRSRTLDLDLLLYGCRVDASRRLPRADVLRYPFVLAPLVDLAPELVHPLNGIRLDVAWRACSAQRPALTNIGRF